MIPIEEALVYVQPIYLRASGGRIPELKRVVVAYQNRVLMRESFEAGLEELFGGDVPSASTRPTIPVADTSMSATPLPAAAPAPAPAPTTSGLAAEARRIYDRALAAQRAGDWATYGREIQALGDVLRQMNGAR